MKRPYCGKEMTLGYIQCRDGVCWTLKEQLVAAFSSFGKESTPLADGGHPHEMIRGIVGSGQKKGEGPILCVVSVPRFYLHSCNDIEFMIAEPPLFFKRRR